MSELCWQITLFYYTEIQYLTVIQKGMEENLSRSFELNPNIARKYFEKLNFINQEVDYS